MTDRMLIYIWFYCEMTQTCYFSCMKECNCWVVGNVLWSFPLRWYQQAIRIYFFLDLVITGGTDRSESNRLVTLVFRVQVAFWLTTKKIFHIGATTEAKNESFFTNRALPWPYNGGERRLKAILDGQRCMLYSCFWTTCGAVDQRYSCSQDPVRGWCNLLPSLNKNSRE